MGDTVRLPPGRNPKARHFLLILAAEIHPENPEAAGRIRDIVHSLMFRRPCRKPTARATARVMTGPLVLEILAAVRENPRRGNRTTGRMFGVDGGRVSECIHGLRCPITGDLLDEPSPLI